MMLQEAGNRRIPSSQPLDQQLEQRHGRETRRNKRMRRRLCCDTNSRNVVFIMMTIAIVSFVFSPTNQFVPYTMTTSAWMIIPSSSSKRITAITSSYHHNTITTRNNVQQQQQKVTKTTTRGIHPREFPSTATNRLCVLYSSNNNNNNKNNQRNNKKNEEYNDLQGGDKIRACIPYILPMLDGNQFGKYILYDRIPILGDINDIVLGPLLHIYYAVPLFSIALFVLFTIGTRFFTVETMHRNVRYNAQQAALIDIALIVPELLNSIFLSEDGTTSLLPRYILEPYYTCIYYTYMSMIGYCIYNNLRGKLPSGIPYLSPAADFMTGPF